MSVAITNCQENLSAAVRIIFHNAHVLPREFYPYILLVQLNSLRIMPEARDRILCYLVFSGKHFADGSMYVVNPPRIERRGFQ